MELLSYILFEVKVHQQFPLLKYCHLIANTKVNVRFDLGVVRRLHTDRNCYRQRKLKLEYWLKRKATVHTLAVVVCRSPTAPPLESGFTPERDRDFRSFGIQ